MKEINIKDLEKNPFRMIGDEWMLVTAGKDGRVNTMTASWGGVGVLWGRNVTNVYLRPQRYTKEFVDAGETFTLSFFDGEQKKAMGLLGSKSGRDVPDKIEQSGLHVTEIDGYPTFEEASLVLVCRKLYVQEMKEACFLNDEDVKKFYADSDFHTMYVSEIIRAYQK